MSKSTIRVRIAPSPTGFAHVGTAYTALFNYAYVKKNQGKFVLRLEDTDIKRHVKGAEEAIYDGLSWLGLNWDEGPVKGGKYGPYRQSERLEIYKEKANELKGNGLAYEDDGAIRFKNPGKDISWEDKVRGKVTFPGGEVTDFVLLKSNGYPTYNFAVVVDDILMKISHVIRGEEHISNTPRQLALYYALRQKPPEFAHLPTLRNKERKKLSKRKDPVDLRIYQKEGYLPEALVNFLCLLGWSHPKEKEIFLLSEFVKLFSLNRVRKAGPIFNVEKLDWINGEYIRRT
ncbi:MAG: glutamate--tRNA ligase, partial [Patescibacteria group bacterium]